MILNHCLHNNKKEEGEGGGKGSESGPGTGAETKTKTGNENAEILRLSATRQADEALNEICERINDGFNGGRVNRTQALSWLIIRQASSLTDAMIQEIRTEFFDEVAMLESILRQAKISGKVPAEIKSLLQKQIGLEDQPKRRAKAA